MKNQHVVAACILVAVVVWMIIPQADEGIEEPIVSNGRAIVAMPEGEAVDQNSDAVTVRAARINPQPYAKQVRVRGRTKATRHVEVRAEEAGRIVSEPVPRGARVEAGDILCEIAVDNRATNLLEAESRREQAELEYRAALDLQRRGLQSEVTVAQLKAARDTATAAVSRAELALEKTKIRAPFAGIVENRTVEIGDLLNVGSVCASVLDDSPMLLVGLVPEQNIASITVGAQVSAELLGGQQLTGKVSYLSRAADPASRSYRIEVEVDPRYENLREGITTELFVNTAQIEAYLIPPSALTLDDSGTVGVKLIGDNNRVYFQRVDIVGDNTSELNPGIWVSGPQGPVSLITLGQEMVFAGQQVESNYDWSN